MADKKTPQEPTNNGSEPAKSVLQEIEGRTGADAKLMLDGSDSVQVGGSPYVDPKGIDKSLLPKGKGNYQILGEIARGGMGTVLKGHDTDLGRDIAVKVLEPELARRPEVLQRFVEEAQIGGQLQHPGIVPVYELGLMSDERPYFTMKLIKGRTLSALLSARRSLEEDRTRFLKTFESVCQTVAYAHSKGVIHRDLKPANIMVGAFGEVQVVDWGLAKVLKRGGVEDEKRAEALSHLTVIETVRSGPGSSGTDSVIGSVMGTPAYMPPEQAMGDLGKVDETSDVFALGAILCEILTGKAPYVDEDRRRVVEMASQAELDPARARIEASGAAPELIKLCISCLAPSRMARPRNAEDLANRIHDFLSSTEERAQEARVKAVEERRRRHLAVVLGATIVLALVSIGGAYLWLETQRAGRVAETERLFEEQHAKALEQQEAGEYAEALTTACEALRVVEASDVGGNLGDRARRFVANAEERASAQAQRLASVARNEAQIRLFEDLRLKTADFSQERDEIGPLYVAAFADYGLDMEADDLEPALDAMLESGMAEEFSIALDEWALLKRRLSARHNEDPWPAERLQLVATDLDPHPLRMRMRKAILARDKDALIELTSLPNLRELRPATIWVLSRALLGDSEHDIVRRMLEDAVGLHPRDFILNFGLGWVYTALDREDIGVRYTALARSLRPENAYINGHLGDVLANQGQMAASLRAFQGAVRVDPEWPNGYVGMGNCCLWLGKFEDMVIAREREMELERKNQGGDDSDDLELIQAELNAARYCLGEVTKDDMLDWLWDAEERRNRMQVAYALLIHPDPNQRDPAATLRAAQHRVSYSPKDRFAWNLAMQAHVELGNYEEALKASDRFDELRLKNNRLNEVSLCLVRSTAFHHLGDEARAAVWFERGDDQLSLLRFAYPEDWSRSSVVRRRDETATLLGL
jgi:serine/threonine-protein kinase